MGSICGIVSKNKIDLGLFKNMEAQLAHRGRKTKEYYENNSCFVARKHNITRPDQKTLLKNHVLLIMDGELYNHQQLKVRLQKKNERFKTDSDEELVIKTYLKYGERFVTLLDGEFALALWDKNKNKLMLARDKIGVKPLYYYHSQETVIFASEIKAILQYPLFKKEINDNAIKQFFSFFYYIPCPETIFKGVYNLPPSHLMVYDKNRLKSKRYWTLHFYSHQKRNGDFLKKELIRKLENSTKKRMKEQTGVLLSGGIDSSVIAAMAAGCSDRQIKTFSAGFECTNEFNESDYAREVADYLKTDHYEMIIKSDDIKNFSKLIWYLDDLGGSGSTAITSHRLLELANNKECIQVFTGHEMELGVQEFVQVERLVNIGNKIPAKLKQFIFPNLFQKYPSLNKALYIMRNSEDIGMISAKLSSLFQEEELKEALQTNQKPVHPIINRLFKDGRIDSTFNKLRYIELKINLPNFNLTRYDRLGMANSVEVKFPFLDSEFVEFSAMIPLSLSVKGKKDKIILKQAFVNKLPKRILERKRHPGRPPLKLWIAEQQDFIFENILELSKRGYFKKGCINYLMKNYSKDKNYLKIWALFSFETWYKTFMEKD